MLGAHNWTTPVHTAAIVGSVGAVPGGRVRDGGATG